MKTLKYFPIIALIFVSATCSKPEDILKDISNGMQALLSKKKPPNYLLEAMKDLSHIKNKKIADETFCETCKTMINDLILYRRTGANTDSMINLLRNLCAVATDWGKTACEGYIEIEIDSILYIIDNKRNLTPNRFCAIYFQAKKCVDPEAKNWTIPLPHRRHHHRTQHRKVESNDKDIKVLHLTDIHYDPLYKEGSNAKCDEPLCCQSGTPSKPENAAGYWGDYNVCDMPWHSITQLMDYIKSRKDDFHHIYYTGDIISHKSWATSVEYNTDSIKSILKLFKTTFKKTPVYPILGNHEPHPTDFYSPENLSNSKVSTHWIFDLVAEEWAHWLPNSTIPTILKGGYYTVLVKPGFRIIALNSNVCFTSNLWLVYDDEDPYGQLKWLVDELEKAEKNNERVHILSHIPPGEVLCHKQWSNQFKRIVNRFAKTISAQFNGHTHLDEIRIFKDSNDPEKVINVAFNGGSFTTFVGFNPNFRFYYVDSNNYMVTDYEEYVYNLTRANAASGTDPEWYKLYSFKDAYGLSGMKMKDLKTFLDKILNDDELVSEYHRFQVRDSDIYMENGCNEGCLKLMRCSIQAVDTEMAVEC